MKAPKREYRYRLYSTPRVTCGVQVAAFIYEHSGGIIRLDWSGDVDFVPELVTPIQRESVEILYSDKLFADGFSVVLLNDDLAEPLFWYDGYAVVSRGGLKIGRVKGPDLPIYAYLTLAAIVGHELSSHLPDITIPAFSDLRPFGWEAAIKSGRLPAELHELLVAQKSPIESEFTSAVVRVLEAIAMESSDVHAVSTAQPDPSQQAIRKRLPVADKDRKTQLDILDQPRYYKSEGRVEELYDPSGAEDSIEPQEAAKEAPDDPLKPEDKPDLPTAPVGAKVAAAMSEYETPPDALGYETYANALGDLITNPDTETPMVIAICAHWGMGKTTLMDYIEKRIESKNEE